MAGLAFLGGHLGYRGEVNSMLDIYRFDPELG
jgi:hypothetical protein